MRTAKWAHRWLQLNVGTDIALAHAIGREIIASGLLNRSFIDRATGGFDAYAAGVQQWAPEGTARKPGCPPSSSRNSPYARADRAQLCWTLAITEHHNGTDNILSLINLSLLTGYVGRYGSGLNPLRGQNNVQGGGDMGAADTARRPTSSARSSRCG